MAPVKILLIDPDPATRSVVSAALDGRGYEISPLEDGEVGLLGAISSLPDVILLSAAAPRLDIPNFVRTLRTRPESALVPVIFIGDQAPIEEQIQGFQLGSDDFLHRPLDPRDLELRIAVANKLRQKAENMLRPKPMDMIDFSSPGIMTAFKGTLDQIGLPSILSLVDMERKTGMLVLILEPGKEKARIHFHDGRVVRAAYDKKDRPKNAQMIYELLAHTEGKFEFRNMMIDAKDEVQSPTAHLLLEGARLIDEGRHRAQ
ncbi:MAG: response regulator [Planctomycetes bacterium]|nr:response regulator [Planctomycetota bacterium]